MFATLDSTEIVSNSARVIPKLNVVTPFEAIG